MRSLTIFTTGGTIEKTYNEASGELENSRSVVERMLARLRLEDARVRVVSLLSKDSLHITEPERAMIVERVAQEAAALPPFVPGQRSGIVVLHGTDTLSLTGEAILARLSAGGGRPRVPIVLTGAMRPFEMRRSDSLQNLTESILATALMPPGVYACAHGRVLAFPGVVKDRARGTFVHPEAGA